MIVEAEELENEVVHRFGRRVERADLVVVSSFFESGTSLWRKKKQPNEKSASQSLIQFEK